MIDIPWNESFSAKMIIWYGFYIYNWQRLFIHNQSFFAQMTVNISGLNKARLLIELANDRVGYGIFLGYSFTKGQYESAKSAVTWDIDYFMMSPIKTDLRHDEVGIWLYDRDHGKGRFKEIVDAVRETQDHLMVFVNDNFVPGLTKDSTTDDLRKILGLTDEDFRDYSGDIYSGPLWDEICLSYTKKVEPEPEEPKPEEGEEKKEVEKQIEAFPLPPQRKGELPRNLTPDMCKCIIC